MTVQQLALRVDQTPAERHADARRHVVTAICLVAERNGGTVSPNVVRRYLATVPEWQIPPSVVGATYRSLRRSGHLTPAGHEVSDDVSGGNSGKLHNVYVWTGDVA